jgi:glycosyltransferase involved in cell wall biosynthesis
MRLKTITPLILTYNEEPNIGRVLEKLTWADHIVVVDSFSTDRTLQIVRACPQAEVLQRPFDNFADQRNFGIARVQTPWVLSLDADYVLSDELIEELNDTSEAFDRDGYVVPFRYVVADKPLRGSLYPPRLALFKKEQARYVPDGHSELLMLDGGVGRLTSVIYHDDRKPLSAWLRAQDRYSALEAEKLATTPIEALGRIDRLRRKKWVAPLLTTAYCLFRKGLILDGWPGWYYTFQRTYAELLLSLKLIERDLLGEAPSEGSTRLPSPNPATLPQPRAAHREHAATQFQAKPSFRPE